MRVLGARYRYKASQLMEGSEQATTVSRIFDITMIVLIIANVLAIMLESVASLAEKYGNEFYWFEIFSIVIFTLEYFIRVWSCPEIKNKGYSDDFKGRLKYILSFPALVDLAAILPFYLTFFISIDLRFLRVFRILRVFKLTRYSSAMNMLLKVLKEESSAFFAAFSILTIVLILTASGIYLLEHDIQPEAFGSIPAAMWWATSTLTTVGYGDVTPITPMGRLFGGLITVIGMGMVALPAGILASGFSAQLKQNRTIYRSKLIQSYSDGVLTEQEKGDLELLRRELGINEHEAELLLFAHRQHQHSQDGNKAIHAPKVHQRCPHCHESID
ncbi:ion transporter [Psychrobium sp. 1_MG-2023]|uniref:ion transporter n=1 Tax=Psychrobium sp. 1_MG-2023 TaxID=3062624 RepID=UPI000C3430FC|nr:ion transporter [Psychrobium sp. 1_MG-2023]MDP2560832.1 ion transporter [Psychrobium sp. 1_MG-2023]PKF56706.1 Ion transport protein [Alteromonadales bacterium alter-6D02]